MKSSHVATLAWSSLVLATACGGKVLFEQASGAGGASTAIGTTGSVFGPKNSAVVGTTGTGLSGPSTSVATGNGSTNVSTVGGSTVGGSTVGVSASSGGPLPPVYCNGQPCPTNELCCFNPNGPGDHCDMNGQCTAGFVELQCSAPANCPGAVCCAHTDAMGRYQGTACAPSCQGPGDHIICTKNPGVCPGGQTCHQSMQLGNGYRVCY